MASKSVDWKRRKRGRAKCRHTSNPSLRLWVLRNKRLAHPKEPMYGSIREAFDSITIHPQKAS